ncbi:hypothetical protein [Streptomyces sp. NPDC093018]|uniref:hypothetical protein n=1 Tax=Streptomyces sp. NPDC093018 TaxID=3155067 RepID=UPI00342AF9FD
MNAPSRPSLKSVTPTPGQPRAAEQAVPRAAVGEPKGAARQGVRNTLLPDPHPTDHTGHDAEDPTPERPGIRISAPPVYRHHYDGARWAKRYDGTPTAAYACPCGQTRTARGQDAVAALVTEYAAHKHFCTGTPAPDADERAAA